MNRSIQTIKQKLLNRPTDLNPLFSSLSSLKGIGPRVEKKLQKIDIKFPKDLIFHIPHKYIHRKKIRDFSELKLPEIIMVEIIILKYISKQSHGPLRILVGAKNFKFYLLFFKIKSIFLEKILPVGERRVVSGKLELFENELQMIHPEYISKVEDKKDIPTYDPLYPLTAGLSNKYLGKCIRNSLNLIGKVDDWLNSEFLKSNSFPEFKSAIRMIHGIGADISTKNTFNARRRLIFDEFFAHSICLSLRKLERRRKKGIAKNLSDTLSKSLISNLNFKLTKDQRTAIIEINKDLAQPFQMNRFLQGDVGSGKTIVALITMLNVLEKGYQVALLAPTEILAFQHFKTIKNLVANLGIEVLIFTGSDKGEIRQKKLADIEEGIADLIIGTHALFQKDIIYSHLQYVVIDEQHRFGVNQRMALLNKGNNVDLLMMSATPIPRSMYMVRYGDLDLSTLKNKPEGRSSIKTAVIPNNKIPILIERLKLALKESQAYWICPLVEETEGLDLIAAKKRFSELSSTLPDINVGLLHGKMIASEKEKVIEDFATNKIKLLISTTVVEVGVDVPNASIMIVEGAERFGLAQLHQIRGRVGRGERSSSCTLLHHKKISPLANERLQKLKVSNDGFEIAEFDLLTRGEGEVVGTKQSGMPNFRIADPVRFVDILEIARKEADNVLDRDPYLESPQGKRIIYLLNILGKTDILQ